MTFHGELGYRCCVRCTWPQFTFLETCWRHARKETRQVMRAIATRPVGR